MQTIGERLEEARKRLGIALREASEATKIRGDYLVGMENGTFDFAVPEVYKRGFLKIYARYLKLDVEKIAADYNTQYTTSIGAARISEAGNLGRVEMPGSEVSSTGADTSAVEVEAPYRGAPADGLDTGDAQSRAMIIRFVAYLGVIVLVGLIVYAFSKYLLGDASATGGTQTTTQTGNVTAVTPPPPPKPVAPPVQQFVLTAQNDITNLTVVQSFDHHELYNKALKKGVSVPISSQGKTEISVSQTQNLLIVQNGKSQTVGDASGKPLTGPSRFYWPPGAP